MTEMLPCNMLPKKKFMLKWTLLMVAILLLVYEPQECEGKFGVLKAKFKQLKDKMKKMGKKNNNDCNCKCREYWTVKCSVEMKNECKQLYTHRECKKVPVKKPMRMKEVECQKCVRYPELRSKTVTKRQCMSVYDEKCMTKYPAKCVKEQTCTMVYRTMCEMEGYSQKCKQMPSESCVPVTKCHRIPKTQCTPIKEKECGDVQVQVPVRQMVYKCQPFENREDENLDACMGMMQGNDMFAPPPALGYGPPGGVTPNFPGSTNPILLPLMQQQQQQQTFNVDPGLSAPVPNSYTSSQQVPSSSAAQFSSPSQNFNANSGQSQPLPNSYASSQSLNAPTQSFAQTITNNNNINNNNNAPRPSYSGTQQQFLPQQQNINTNSVSNYNSGPSTLTVFPQQNGFGGSVNNPNVNNYGSSGFNQQQGINTYSTNTNGLLTPNSQLQQPFVSSNGPSQTFAAPSTYTSPLLSNYAIQTPFAPAINTNSNNQDTYGTPLSAPLGGFSSNSLNSPISGGSTYSSVSNSLPLQPRTPLGNTNTGNTFVSNLNSWQNQSPQAPSTMANVKIVNPSNPFLRTPNMMQTSASTQPWQNSVNSNSIQNGNNNNWKNNNLMDMLSLTPTFYGLDNMINGLKGMMRGGKLVNTRGKEMTMITPTSNELNSGPSPPGEVVSLDPFFRASPKIPMNFMPSAAINEVSSDGWTINNGGTPAVPTLQTDLGYPKSISSVFGDNTLTNPTEIKEQESLILTSQGFVAVPNPKLVVGEVLVEDGQTKNMVFPDQKARKGKKQEEKSFRLPKCLESFESCVEDAIEGRALDSKNNNLLLSPDGGVWKTLKINGKKWLLANTTSEVDDYNRNEPSMFIVFDNKTVMRNTSLFIPKQQRISRPKHIKKKKKKNGLLELRILESDGNNNDENEDDYGDISSEELMVREILNNLQLLKEQEKLALLGPENDIDLDRLDDSVKIILVDKVKDTDMMKKIKNLEEGEMILMDDDYGSSNDHNSNVHTRHQKTKKRQNDKSKTYNVVVKKKPRRRQRVKIRRGYGNKVQKVYITY